MNTPLIRSRRPWDLGTWLWLLNRIAGVICIVYLMAHICVISTTQRGQAVFDGVMTVMHNPAALALELLLIFTVLAHGLIGLRHIAIDFGLFKPRQHKVLFGAAVAVGLLACALALSVMWPVFV